MTAERLQKCSIQTLRELAEKEGIVLVGKTNKDILIELILEALDEDRQERELENNPAMRIRETKYETALDEELDPCGSGKYTLPSAYNETKIVLLLRDPSWAFAYWELKSLDLEEVRTQYRNFSLYLRVWKSPVEPEKAFSKESFDIPVGLGDRNWYINLPETGKIYEIELLAGNKSGEAVLCRSNSVVSPAFKVSEAETEQVLNDKGNDLNLLSKLYNFGEESAMQEIPQRIISLLDTRYLRIKG
ncbi:MAG: DUF4912 domain-containing protein [Spirochaetales bacterium]|nr:DUF4912 domain-containing protein [Spirochaetales bacterium]